VYDDAQAHRVRSTSWKKWLAIYAIAGAIVYVIVYVVFFAHSGGGVGPY